MHQALTLLPEVLNLILLPRKHPYNPGACQALPRKAQHHVQTILYFFIQWDRRQHNSINHQGKHRNQYHKNPRQPGVHHKRHHYRPDNDKRRAQKQAQQQVYPSLCLIDITGKARHQRRSPNHVQLRIRKTVNMPKQILPKRRPKTRCCFCRKILRRS